MNFFKTQLKFKPNLVILCVCLFCILVVPTNLVLAQGTDVAGPIKTFFWELATGIGGQFIRLGSYVLNVAVVNLVVGMGTLLNGAVGVAVNSVWVVIRDTFNLVFIFALVYIGLRIIWDAGDGGAKRNLARLIVAALLINFSLFFAKVIVDMGNIAAIQIYGLYANLQTSTTGGLVSALDSGIGQFVLHHLDLTQIASGAIVPLSASTSYGFILMVMLFLIVTGLVFLAGAIMLLGRFVLLVIYLMFAPFMFIGLIIPNFGSYQTQWWNGFLKQVFVAPAFLFTTYIALRIIAIARQEPGFSGGFVAFLAGDETSGGGVIVLFVAIGFMLLALSLSNKMGAVGAATSIKVGQNIRQRGQRFAGAATAGMAARAGRNTAGALGAGATSNSNRVGRRLNQLAVDGNLLQRTLARGVQGTGQKMATSSYDVRQAAGLGTALGVGEGKKGGIKAIRDEEDKKDRERRGRASDAEQIRTAETAITALGDAGTASAALEGHMNDLGRAIRNMTGETRAGLGVDMLSNEHVALNLTDAHIEDLRRNGYSSQQIRQITDARNQAQQNIASTGFATTATDRTTGATVASNTSIRADSTVQNSFRERLTRGGVTATGNVAPAAFAQQSMYEYITPQMLEERLRNGVSGSNLSAIRTAVRTHLGLASTGSVTPHGSGVRGAAAWATWYDRSGYASRIFG
jgi:hypothetical protein